MFRARATDAGEENRCPFIVPDAVSRDKIPSRPRGDNRVRGEPGSQRLANLRFTSILLQDIQARSNPQPPGVEKSPEIVPRPDSRHPGRTPQLLQDLLFPHVDGLLADSPFPGQIVFGPAVSAEDRDWCSTEIGVTPKLAPKLVSTEIGGAVHFPGRRLRNWREIGVGAKSVSVHVPGRRPTGPKSVLTGPKLVSHENWCHTKSVSVHVPGRQPTAASPPARGPDRAGVPGSRTASTRRRTAPPGPLPLAPDACPRCSPHGPAPSF